MDSQERSHQYNVPGRLLPVRGHGQEPSSKSVSSHVPSATLRGRVIVG